MSQTPSAPTAAAPERAAPTPGRPGRRYANLAVAGLLLLVGAVSLHRAVRMRYDFHHFYRDARYVWEHRALNPRWTPRGSDAGRQLPFYLPAVPALLSPWAAGDVVPAALVWTAMHLLSIAWVAWCGLPRIAKAFGVPPEALTFWACLLAAPAAYEAARFNQLSFLVLAVVLAGAQAVQGGRDLRGGALLGLAALLKLLPALLVLWLLMRRRGRAAAAFAATFLTLAVMPCLLAFGPARTVAYHRQWFDYNVRGVLARGLAQEGLRGHFIDHRNQGIRAVVERLTVPEHPYAAPFQPARLTPRAASRVALALWLALLAALLWHSRRTEARNAPSAAQVQIALYLLAMLVLSPLLRQYYLVWAWPALYVALAAVACGHGAGVSPYGRWAIGLWLAGLIAWLWPTARLYGVHLVVLILLGGLLIAIMRRVGRAALCDGPSRATERARTGGPGAAGSAPAQSGRVWCGRPPARER